MDKEIGTKCGESFELSPNNLYIIISTIVVSHPEKEVAFSIIKERKYKYSDFITLELPDSCDKCPVGYQTTGEPCGRNVPYTDIDFKQRPISCKLIKIDIPKD